MKKKCLSIAIALLSVSFAACGDNTVSTESITESVSVNAEEDVSENLPDISESEPEPEPVPEATHIGGFEISGDRLTAIGGEYEQDGNTENGTEEINWIVLEDNGDTLLLISRDILDCVRFNDSYDASEWDDSYIREFLNDTFYISAFNDEEKAIIEDYPTTVEDVSENIPGVNDKVFLLSYDEVIKYMGTNPDGTDESRMASSTQYAVDQGVWTIDEEEYSLFGFEKQGVSSEMIGCGNWWLRTSGAKTTEAMDVGASGIIRTTGHDVGSRMDGIRPAILIRISQ